MLNPYKKELAISQNDALKVLESKASLESMKTFTLTYDRHKGKYSFREKDFPASYKLDASPLEYVNDPDWSVKFEI